MAFLGLRKWPTPARFFLLPNHDYLTRFTWFIDRQALVAIPDCGLDYRLLCWKGSGFWYQVYVHVVHAIPSLPAHLLRLAPEWRTDPRNPYAAQLAKESLH